jgi:hypothetical protein
MSIVVPDHKIALRDYLQSQASILSIIGTTERVVTDFESVKDARHWIVLTRAGGTRDLYVPIRRPRIDIVCYGSIRWEATRLASAVSDVLGLDDVRKVPRIEAHNVIITDIQPDGDMTDGLDDRVPGVNARIPFVFQSVVLTVHRV